MIHSLCLLGAAAGLWATSVVADSIHGDATFTSASMSGGTCSFANYTFPPDIFGAGLGPANWAGGSKCGSCLQVDGPSGSVRTMIVDSCPSCNGNRLNLLSEAYNRVAGSGSGIIPISYEPVACGISAPLSVRNKVGASKYFFSMQVLDCNYPLTGLDISADGGNTWQPTVRKEYNYFEKGSSGGFGEDTLVVRISCSNGRRVILPDVSMAGGAKTVAPVNC